MNRASLDCESLYREIRQHDFEEGSFKFENLDQVLTYVNNVDDDLFLPANLFKKNL